VYSKLRGYCNELTGQPK